MGCLLSIIHHATRDIDNVIVLALIPAILFYVYTKQSADPKVLQSLKKGVYPVNPKNKSQRSSTLVR